MYCFPLLLLVGEIACRVGHVAIFSFCTVSERPLGIPHRLLRLFRPALDVMVGSFLLISPRLFFRRPWYNLPLGNILGSIFIFPLYFVSFAISLSCISCVGCVYRRPAHIYPLRRPVSSGARDFPSQSAHLFPKVSFAAVLFAFSVLGNMVTFSYRRREGSSVLRACIFAALFFLICV